MRFSFQSKEILQWSYRGQKWGKWWGQWRCRKKKLNRSCYRCATSRDKTRGLRSKHIRPPGIFAVGEYSLIKIFEINYTLHQKFSLNFNSNFWSWVKFARAWLLKGEESGIVANLCQQQMPSTHRGHLESEVSWPPTNQLLV